MIQHLHDTEERIRTLKNRLRPIKEAKTFTYERNGHMVTKVKRVTLVQGRDLSSAEGKQLFRWKTLATALCAALALDAGHFHKCPMMRHPFGLAQVCMALDHFRIPGFESVVNYVSRMKQEDFVVPSAEQAAEAQYQTVSVQEVA